MKVGVYYNNRDVRVEERPVPVTGEGDILVRVMASGICGSDVMEWYRVKKAPLVLGHEVAGEVVEAGPRVRGLKPGDRIWATHHVPCGDCDLCRRGHETACESFQMVNNFDPGGFAEYLRVTGRSVETGTLLLPGGVTFEAGSFVEPLGTVVRALRAAGLGPGDSLLVLGSGIAGLLAVKLARALGAGRVMATDVVASRLAAARRFGANDSFPAGGDVPEMVRAANGGRLADKVFLAAGAMAAARQALASVARGGTVVLFAVPRPGETLAVDFNPFWRNDVRIMTSYGAAPADAARALELIGSGAVEVGDLVTHRYGLDGIGEAFRAAAGAGDSLKVIVEPHRARVAP